MLPMKGGKGLYTYLSRLGCLDVVVIPSLGKVPEPSRSGRPTATSMHHVLQSAELSGPDPVSVAFHSAKKKY